MLSRKEALNINISTLGKVHFIGITSGFNSFCANYLLSKGVAVTASEINQESEEAKEWIRRGVLYEGGHDEKYVTEDLDLVVYPNGPIPGNPECEKAEELGLNSMTIGQLTGLIGKNFKVIAVAGTHGKTTTSGLIVWGILKALGEPNFIIGDRILGINKSWNYNPESDYLVIEACEYKRQFLDRAPTPYISVITNIELDHTDYYKSQDDYNSAFIEFVSNTQRAVVLDLNGKNEKDVADNIKSDIEIFNIENIREERREIKIGNLFGEHNYENALRAIAVGEILNIAMDLTDFPGISSRFEYIGKTVNNMPLFLDYAHNPKKIDSCLKSARSEFAGKKVVLIWQPHSTERSFTFREEFAKSLESADIVLIPNIYSPARESQYERSLVSDEDFVKYLAERNPEKEVLYTRDFKSTADILNSEKYNEEYIAVFASAGDLKNIFNLIEFKEE